MDQKADGPILVFLGPTLRLPDAQRTLDAIYLQPVSQGDIILAAHAFRPKAMVLIDGLFEDRPAVRHKEILWALSQGIVMIGAASMGALRAAELHPFGMIGVGSHLSMVQALAADSGRCSRGRMRSRGTRLHGFDRSTGGPAAHLYRALSTWPDCEIRNGCRYRRSWTA